MKLKDDSIGRNAKKEVHDLSDRLFDNCHMDVLTGRLHYKNVIKLFM